MRLAQKMQALCMCATQLLDGYDSKSQDTATERSRLYADGIPRNYMIRQGELAVHMCT